MVNKKRLEKIMHYLAVGFSQKEIAKRIGITQGTVSRNIQKIRRMYGQGEIDVDVAVRKR